MLGSTEQEQKYVDYLDQVAEDFVNGPFWPVIEYVAGVLLDRKHLSPAEARAAIRTGLRGDDG